MPPGGQEVIPTLAKAGSGDAKVLAQGVEILALQQGQPRLGLGLALAGETALAPLPLGVGLAHGNPPGTA